MSRMSRMRWIWSVTSALCLLMVGVAWAQTGLPETKSPHRQMSHMLEHWLELAPNADARMLRHFGVQERNRFQVSIHTRDASEIQALLDAKGLSYRQVGSYMLYANNLSKSQINEIAQLSGTWVGMQPRAVLRRGSVTSAGDDTLRAADLRASLGVDGSGVNIGIISNGLVNLQDSVDSGDLPDDVQIVNGMDGDSDTNTDEGRAMAEIIHDLAPGANLFFQSGFPTSADMIAAIEGLTAAGAHVIVDDIGFLAEPVFEDGPVAQAVQAAVDSGIVYVTAAGNSALNNYQAMYREFNPNDGLTNENFHDFGGGDRTMAVTLSPNGLIAVFLHWADRFDGQSSTADYNLHLFDASGTINPCTLPGLNGFCNSVDPQLTSSAPPLELVAIQNTTNQAVTINIMINRFDGDALPLQLLFNGGGFTIEEHNVTSRSIFGHPCVSEAIAVAAIDVNDPGFDTIEPFSSQGPCDIYFPIRQTRFKPDLTGADGVNTSLPFFTPFFGTSAAAPHIAAIAALLIELGGGPDVVIPSHIRNFLRLGTTDLGAVGPDSVYGHGVSEAVQAGNLVQSTANIAPQSIIQSPADDIVITPGEQPLFQGQCVDAGEDVVPFTFAWDFGGGAPASMEQNPGSMPFNIPGVFTVTFTCTDSAGLSDPTPDSRTVTVNRAPRSFITSHASSVIIEAGARLNFTGTCDDPEDNTPFSFLWVFHGGADRATSTEQNPSNVRYSTPGDYSVSFSCRDAFGLETLTPAVVRVLVNPATNQGGGGCSLVAGASGRPLDGLGNIGLPLLAIAVLWIWRRRGGAG